MQKTKKLEYIEKASKFGIDLSLDRILVLMDSLGNPQDKLKFIHVAGTNGKGSTCAIIESILSAAGYKTGMFISPHLELINERMSVNGGAISDDEFERLSSIVAEKTEKMVEEGLEHPTQFEIICAMAFVYFFEKECDIVVLEVGLGGRLDATNIIKTPLVSVITTIDYDHTDRLGNTIEEITGEKVGIIKQGCAVVSAPQGSSAMDVIKRACIEKDCKLTTVDTESLKFKNIQGELHIFDFEDYENLSLGLKGLHQLINASVAIKTINALRKIGLLISDDSIYQGLKSARNNGRFEILGHKPEIIIDGAHNISGINALKEALIKYYAGKRIILVMAVLSVKNYIEMVEILAPLADWCIASEPVSENALPAEELAKCFKRNGKECISVKEFSKAVDLALTQAGEDDVVCFCGSLYFIGHVRTYYNNLLGRNQ